MRRSVEELQTSLKIAEDERARKVRQIAADACTTLSVELEPSISGVEATLDVLIREAIAMKKSEIESKTKLTEACTSLSIQQTADPAFRDQLDNFITAISTRMQHNTTALDGAVSQIKKQAITFGIQIDPALPPAQAIEVFSDGLQRKINELEKDNEVTGIIWLRTLVFYGGKLTIW
jgi:predicted secreted Zn-dependent protease